MNSKNAKTNAKFVGVVALDDTNFIGNTQKGITLIALVITIIVLLILAGVTINMVLGDDGIIAQAQAAKEKQSDAETLEIIEEAVAAQRINKLAGTGKTIDLEKVLKENLKADNVTVTEQNGEYLITVTKNGETKNYKVASNGKASKMEDGLIAYVEALKVAKGGESGFDTIAMVFSNSRFEAKGFNFEYNGEEYTYIIEENAYIGQRYTIAEILDEYHVDCTLEYPIHDNIVTEFKGNVLGFGSGEDACSNYTAIILPETVTNLGGNSPSFGIGSPENWILKELKVNGTLSNVGKDDYIKLPADCIVYYQGNKYTSAEFLEEIRPKPQPGETAVEITANSLIEGVEELKVQKGGVAGFDTIELTYNESTTLTAKGFNFKYNGKEYTYVLENENTYLGGYVTIGENWICNGHLCTSNYDIKDNIVTEFQGNVQLSSGVDVTSVYKGIILPSSVTSLGAGTFRNESGAGLEELKINGTLTELGGYVYLPESCIVHYGGNKMTSADFIASFNN